jgi:ribonuclease D
LFGDDALALKRGELALVIRQGEVAVIAPEGAAADALAAKEPDDGA